MNKRNNLGIIVVVSALSMLAGCKDKIQTVDWYKIHEKERKEMLAKCNERLKECKTNPVKILTDPHCLNAQEAEMKVPLGKPFDDEKGKLKPLEFKWDDKKGLVMKN